MYLVFKLLGGKQCAFLIRFALSYFCVMARKNYAKKVRRDERNRTFVFERKQCQERKKKKKDFFLPSSFSFPNKKFGKQTEEGEERKTAE